MGRHILLYGHGGCHNHGNEALTSCTIKVIREILPNCKITLSTHFKEQDMQFRLCADEFIERNIDGKTNTEVYQKTLDCITPRTVCIHIAGDNFCYQNWQRYTQMHYKALSVSATSILWSCSIDPDVINDEMLDTLRTHHLITARECITHDALLELGLKNVVKVADIAFLLEPKTVCLNLDNYVAMNISPLIMRKNPLTKEMFESLINYIINNTDMNIALVPHVIAKADNDCDAFHSLNYPATKRIVAVSNKLSAAEYKYIVSKARFCVTARTHLAIAAYSSHVPTLALGYNIKALGIASDLKVSDYVVDIDNSDIRNLALGKLVELIKNEDNIRNTLSKQIDSYKKASIHSKFINILKGGI